MTTVTGPTSQHAAAEAPTATRHALQTLLGPSCDRLTRLAVALLQAPLGLLTFVTAGEQWLSSVAGDPELLGVPSENPAALLLCRQVAAQASPLLIADRQTTPESVAAELPAYLGIPLLDSAGRVIGTLGVYDRQPRPWSATDLALLTDLSATLVAEIGLRHQAQQLAAAEQLLSARETALQQREEYYGMMMVQNITQRKQIEGALRERQVLLRNIIDNAPMTICAVDADGQYILVNRLFAERAGVEHPRDLLGRSMIDVFPVSMAERFQAENERMLLDGQAMHLEDLDLRSGTPENWLITKFPIYDQDRLMLGIGAISVNVTDQRRLEREYEHFFTATPDLLAILSPAQGVRRFNPAWEQLLGYTQEELQALPSLHELFHPEDREASLLRFAPLQTQTTTITLENRFRCGDGSYKWLEWTVSSYVAIGPVYYYVSARDMTERRLVAERLEQTYQEMRHANVELARVARLKDEFLANMSHELRTPLNAVLGLSETLQEELYGPLNERQLRSLRGISESGRHLLELINDVLDLSKVEAGKMDLNVQTAVVDSLCQASLRLVKEAAHQKQITINYQRDPAVVQLRCDERRLRQILINLLTNAVKFTPAGGAVGLEVYTDPAATQLFFTVWDTGIGIAPHDLSSLFQPFTQLDSSLVRQHGGTGLGLTIAQRLAQLHHGTVTVESAPGSGSRFSVVLPYHSEPPAGAAEWMQALVAAEPGEPASAASGVSLRPPTILLVDDHVENRTMLTDYLLSRSYRVHTAGDGRTAIQLAETTNPDLILMDVQMPEMNGMDAITAIRRLPQHATTPIIALTALAMPQDRERCLAVGASDYLTKPVRLRALVETIAAHLSQPSLRSATDV